MRELHRLAMEEVHWLTNFLKQIHLKRRPWPLVSLRVEGESEEQEVKEVRLLLAAVLVSGIVSKDEVFFLIEARELQEVQAEMARLSDAGPSDILSDSLCGLTNGAFTASQCTGPMWRSPI